MIKKYLKILVLFGAVVVIILSAFVLLHKKQEVKKVHYHAGFVVFNDNKQVNFTDFKYMLVRPCTTSKKEEVEAEEDSQIEKAHLHDSIGDVVHVEKENSKWSDLFTNLKYPIDYRNTSAYLNGKEVDNFQDLIIQPYDSLVILIGKSDSKIALSKAVGIKHIKETEKRSEYCGS